MDSFEGYMESLGLSEATRGIYGGYADDLTEWLEGRGLLPEHASHATLAAYIGGLRASGQSPATLSNRLAGIRHLMGWLRKIGRINDSPADGLEVRDRARRLPPPPMAGDALERAWHGFPCGTWRQKRDRLALSLMAMQGLGTAEVCALKVGDIDPQGGIVRVRATRKAAGRDIPISGAQLGEVIAYARGKHPSALLLCTEAGGSIAGVMQRLVREAKALGLAESAKQLRASRVAAWARGLGIRKAQYLAGHRYASSTERYLKADPRRLAGAVAIHHPMG